MNFKEKGTERDQENNMNEVVGALSKIIESAENTEKEMTIVQEKVKGNKQILVTLDDSRDTLQNLINESVAQVESSQSITKKLNQCNVKFISEAQRIYSSALKLDNEFDIKKHNLEKIVDVIEENNDKYFSSIRNIFDKKEKQLLNSLREREDYNLRVEQERKILVKENLRLKQELSELNKEISFTEKQISDLEIENTQYDNEVNGLENENVRVTNEINDLLKKIELIKKEKENEESTILEQTANAQLKLQGLKTNFIEITTRLKKELTEEEEMKNELLKIQSSNQEAGNIIISLEKQSIELNRNMDLVSENFNREKTNLLEVHNKKELVLKNEIETQQVLNIIEETEINNLKLIDFDTETLILALNELKPKLNTLDDELATKQDLLQEIKMKLQYLDEEFKKCLTEKQIELEREIVNIECEINKIEQQTQLKEKDIQELKPKTVAMKKEQEQLENISKKVTKESTSNFSVPKAKVQGTRHWDSDTTNEDEDTSYAERIMRKVKMSNKKNKL